MISNSSLLRTLALSAAAGLLAACAQPKVLPTTGPHPALSPDQVKIFQAEPAEYEDLGQIAMTPTPEMKWDEKGDSTVGFDELKKRAAAMGANGILLMQKQGGYDNNVGVGYKGNYYLVPMKYQPRTVLVEAIFVVKEK